MRHKGIILTTDRMVLRPMTDEEWTRIVDSIFENDECLFQFGVAKSDELRVIISEPCRDAVIYYSLVLADDEELVGYVGICPTNSNLELYVFNKYRRQGYAYEGVRTFIDSCMKGRITKRPRNGLYAEVDADNEPCIGLLEKLGFRKLRCGFNLATGAGLLAYDYAAKD